MTDEQKNVEITQEQMQEEKNNRLNAFLEGYKELVDKHDFDFASYPVYVPDGQGGFKTMIQNTPVDMKDQPKKSPFVANNK